MFYAIVAPGISGVYSEWKSIERIKALYPYPKFAKFEYEVDAYNWLKANKYSNKRHGIYNYGSTFHDRYIDVKYKICEDCVYYKLDCKRMGRLRLDLDNAIVEYKGSQILVRFDNMSLSNMSITGHMSAIYNLLDFVGPYVDLNIRVEYYAIFYCLTGYTGSNRYVTTVRDMITERLCEVAVSYDFSNLIGDECDG